jgi:hypothetical protein
MGEGLKRAFKAARESRIKRTLIPEDFEVSREVMDDAQAFGWADPRAEVHAFKNHHIARGTLSVNWDAQFKSWLIKAVKQYGAKPMAKADAKALNKQQELPLTPQEIEENKRRLQELIKRVGK